MVFLSLIVSLDQKRQKIWILIKCLYTQFLALRDVLVQIATKQLDLLYYWLNCYHLPFYGFCCLMSVAVQGELDSGRSFMKHWISDHINSSQFSGDLSFCCLGFVRVEYFKWILWCIAVYNAYVRKDAFADLILW